MTKEELTKRLESAEKQMLGLQDEIENLKAQLAKVYDEPEIPDFPEFTASDQKAWHINQGLEVSQASTICDPGEVDDYNYFHTEEYAF